jgi:cytochrome c
MRFSILVVLIISTWNTWNGPMKKSGNQNISEALTKFSPLAFFSSKDEQEKSLPKVKLHLSQNENLTWGSFVRYTIEVSDREDGDSKYDEIKNTRVLLEIEFLPIKNENELNQKRFANKKEPNDQGLSLMMESSCFACHADKKVMTGPSFSDIAKRYEKNTKNMELLANHILEGSSGQWGNIKMPAYPNLTVEETQKIAAFMLTQGSKKNQQILTGLEGMFQIMEKPADLEQGVYLLTASYTSTSSSIGQQRITLPIK